MVSVCASHADVPEEIRKVADLNPRFRMLVCDGTCGGPYKRCGAAAFFMYGITTM